MTTKLLDLPPDIVNKILDMTERTSDIEQYVIDFRKIPEALAYAFQDMRAFQSYNWLEKLNKGKETIEDAKKEILDWIMKDFQTPYRGIADSYAKFKRMKLIKDFTYGGAGGDNLSHRYYQISSAGNDHKTDFEPFNKDFGDYKKRETWEKIIDKLF